MNRNPNSSDKLILELYHALKNLELQSAWRIWEADELRVTARAALKKAEKKIKKHLELVVEDED
jgi:hypothetical protein